MAGLNLNKLIEKMTLERGVAQTPQGTVRQQVRILKHALTMSLAFYQKDQDFYNSVVSGKLRDTEWAYYGLELSQFIIKMSDGVLSASPARHHTFVTVPSSTMPSVSTKTASSAPRLFASASAAMFTA